MDDIATLLWAGYGVNRPDGKRTAPAASGGDLIDLQQFHLYSAAPGGDLNYPLFQCEVCKPDMENDIIIFATDPESIRRV